MSPADPGSDLLEVQDGYLKDEFGHALELISTRGAAAYVDRINANRPAVLLSGGWQDGIVPPGQNIDFFNRLTVPKRLMYQAGDHATTDILGAVGLPNDAWTETTRWFDHHLRGVENGVDKPRLRLPQGRRRRLLAELHRLERPGPRHPALLPAPARNSASAPKRGRRPSAPATAPSPTAASPWPPGQPLRRAPTGRSARLRVKRADGLVFRTPRLGSTTVISGFPRFRTTVTPSARNTSLFVYLYDEGPGGEARLVTHVPYTLRDVAPGKARTLDLRLQPIRWKLAKGHRLTLVIDTMDVRYRSTSTRRNKITFSSSTTDPSRLTFPVG